MQIGVPREQLAGETRVAASPSSVEQLIKLGFEVCIESKAGALASFDDAAYTAAGATIGSREEIWACPLILKVNAPSDDEIALLKEGATLVSFIWPAQNPALMEKLSSKTSTYWRWMRCLVSLVRKHWMHSRRWRTLRVTVQW